MHNHCPQCQRESSLTALIAERLSAKLRRLPPGDRLIAAADHGGIELASSIGRELGIPVQELCIRPVFEADHRGVVLGAVTSFADADHIDDVAIASLGREPEQTLSLFQAAKFDCISNQSAHMQTYAASDWSDKSVLFVHCAHILPEIKAVALRLIAMKAPSEILLAAPFLSKSTAAIAVAAGQRVVALREFEENDTDQFLNNLIRLNAEQQRRLLADCGVQHDSGRKVVK